MLSLAIAWNIENDLIRSSTAPKNEEKTHDEHFPKVDAEFRYSTWMLRSKVLHLLFPPSLFFFFLIDKPSSKAHPLKRYS